MGKAWVFEHVAVSELPTAWRERLDQPPERHLAEDIDASKSFYDAVLGVLGLAPGREDDRGRVFYMTPIGVFGITKPIDGKPASCGNVSTIGFAAASPEQADACTRPAWSTAS